MEFFKRFIQKKESGGVPADWTPEDQDIPKDPSKREFLGALVGAGALTAVGALTVKNMLEGEVKSEGQKMAEDFASSGMNEGMVHDAMYKAGYRLTSTEDKKNWVKLKF